MKRVKRGRASWVVRYSKIPGKASCYYNAEFFAQADVMLVTLKEEFIFSLTIPSKTQAYMASGKPILTMLNGAGSDVVDEAQCGLTAKSGDYKALAANVKKLYGMNKAEIREMGERAKSYYLKYFEKRWSLIVSMTFYREIVFDNVL